jgi:hypothetical protein
MIRWLKGEIARAPGAWGALLVAGAAWLAYANSFAGAFHFDDAHTIVANPYLRHVRYVPQYFTRPDLFSALPGHDMYRPLVLLSYFLNYIWGGYDPLPWRLTAVALHSFCAVGVFLTFRIVADQFHLQPRAPWRAGALVAALFFAVHPALSEAVDYASARSSVLTYKISNILHRARGKQKRIKAELPIFSIF